MGGIMLLALCLMLSGMLLSGSGWGAAIWQWCRGGDQGLHGMLVSARFITCLTLLMHVWRTSVTFCLNVLLMRELGSIHILLNYSHVFGILQLICILPHQKWFARSSLIPINQNLLYVSLGCFPFAHTFCKGLARQVVHIQTCPPHKLLLALGGCSVLMKISL